jgi:hypothetical protein
VLDKLKRLEIIMQNSVHNHDVHIDHVHSGAVCQEIGEKLAATLVPPCDALPPRLLALMQQFASDEPQEKES